MQSKRKTINRGHWLILVAFWATGLIANHANAQELVCKFNITNNTGESLRRAGSTFEHSSYEIKSGLPSYWRSGDTHTLEYVADLDAIQPLTMYLLEFPIISYDYDGTYPSYRLQFSAFPVGDGRGGISEEHSRCMIKDDGRGGDFDVLDPCKGGNENGVPLYCVDATGDGLDVSMSYGKYFLHYDKTTHEVKVPKAPERVQIASWSDGNLVTAAFNSGQEPAYVRDPDFKSEDQLIRDWYFDGDRIRLGDDGGLYDYCLGIKNARDKKVIIGRCDDLKGGTDWKIKDETIEPGFHHQECLVGFKDQQLFLNICNGNDQQKWVVVKGNTISWIKPESNLNKVMYVSMHHTFSEAPFSGAPVTLSNFESNRKQYWVYQGDYIRWGVDRKLCLDLAQNKTTNGNYIQLWDCNGSNAQQWIYDGITKQFRYKADWSKCLDIRNSGNIQIYNCRDSRAQRWDVANASTATRNTNYRYLIRSVMNDKRCISRNVGHPGGLKLKDCPAGDTDGNKHWLFDWYTIRLDSEPHLCLDGDDVEDGDWTSMEKCHQDNRKQQWIYDGIQRVIRSKANPKKCLSNLSRNINPSGSKPFWTRQIGIEECNGNTRQQFLLEGVPVKDTEAGSTRSIRSTSNQNLCVDLQGGSRADKTSIQLLKCEEGNTGQQWLFDGDRVRSAKRPSRCLDLSGNNNGNGTKIQLYDCNGSNAQRWVYDGVSKQIRYKQNWKKCLEGIYGKNGNNRLWDCGDKPNQQWEIDGATPAEGDTRIKTIHLAKDDGKCINLDGANTNNKTSNIHLYDCTGYGAQKWLFDGINIRYYVQQNKCVDLAYNKTNNGTNIRLWDCNGSDAQHWVYDGMTKQIRYWKNQNKCLVVKRGSSTRGTNIEIQDCNGSRDQRWKIKDADTPFGSDKVMSIKRFIDDKKCMDVDGGKTTSGTNIQLGNCTNNTDQQWTYDGLYLRYKKDPSKCLDLKAANTHRGNNIQLYVCNSTKAQQWLYNQKDHTIRYADNWNRCLEVYKNLNKPGTNIQIYDCRDTDAQRWIMK